MNLNQFKGKENTDDRIASANELLSEIDYNIMPNSGEWEQYLIRYELSGRSDGMKKLLIGKIVEQMLNLLFGGGENMDINNIAVVALSTIMEKTDLDDAVYEAIAEKVKKTIPGDQYEPLIGEFLVQIGTRLKATE
ncbi:MAG: hypothetical protein ACOCQD_02580 [archaeon]